MTERPWPTELRLKQDRKELHVTFDDGVTYKLGAELLRVMSPSAEVQGHSPKDKKTVGGKQDVMVLQIDLIGNYAVRLTFDDMHDSGIYTWDYLHKLGAEEETLWAGYLQELEEKGLNRTETRMV